MELRLAILGFGNVGRELARLLLRKALELQTRHDLTCSVVGVMTARHGSAVNPAGIALETALALSESGTSLNSLSTIPPPEDSMTFIRCCAADVLIELTHLDIINGEPGITHVRTGLEQKMHVVTANKGPLAFAFRDLHDLAIYHDRAFLFEATVLDGTPIFGAVRAGLPASQVLGFQGVLNGTTNHILTQLEAGASFDDAVRAAQKMGIAEADPGFDVDGWDAAVKTVVLANVLMGAELRPADVDRTGIGECTTAKVQAALQRGRRVKLLCRATRRGEEVVARVAPEEVPLHEPLASLSGASSMVILHTDTLHGLGLMGLEPQPAQTAYGLLADLINLARHWY